LICAIEWNISLQLSEITVMLVLKCGV
jgi:hypothetical protein